MNDLVLKSLLPGLKVKCLFSPQILVWSQSQKGAYLLEAGAGNGVAGPSAEPSPSQTTAVLHVNWLNSSLSIFCLN